jgi:hypothetical protein
LFIRKVAVNGNTVASHRWCTCVLLPHLRGFRVGELFNLFTPAFGWKAIVLVTVKARRYTFNVRNDMMDST